MDFKNEVYPTVTFQPDSDTIAMLEFRETEVFTIKKGRGLVPGSERNKYLNSWQSHVMPTRYRAMYSDMKRYYEKNHMVGVDKHCERDNCILCNPLPPKPAFLDC